MKNNYSIFQKLAFVYAFMFFAIALLSYIPWIKDAQGYMFGLFSLQYYDDLLHFSSSVWALLAGLHSSRWSIFYFKLFGAMYFLDSILGLITGRGWLDFGIFQKSLFTIDWGTRIGANLPHFLIGGFALYIGFVLSRKYEQR